MLWEQSLVAFAPVMVPDQLALTTPGPGDGVSTPESADRGGDNRGGDEPKVGCSPGDGSGGERPA